MRELRGKVAVVTGAAGGIGGALVRRLRAEGCRVAMVDARAEELGPVEDGLSAHVMDVADAEAWAALAEAVRAEHCGAELLVNNAGITILGTFAEQSARDLDRIVDVNLKGVLYGCRAFLAQLGARGEGHVVNVSSLAGRVAFPLQSTYCATKHAVRGFSASLRMELAPRGVGVTAVLPGTVATRLLERAESYDRPASQKLARLMLARGASPDRVADRVVRAIRATEAEVLVGWDAHLAAAAHALAPGALYGALGLALRARSRAR